MTVYMFQFGERGPVKIGSSGNFMRRHQVIQQNHWEKLHIIGLMKETPGLEADLHRYFKRLRIKGEWFKYSGKLKEFVGMFPHNMHRADAPLHTVTFYGKRLVVKRIVQKPRKR